jgi:lysophospholipase L1-like esterase
MSDKAPPPDGEATGATDEPGVTELDDLVEEEATRTHTMRVAPPGSDSGAVALDELIALANEEIAAGIKAILNEYRRLCPDAVILLQGIFPRTAEASHPLRARIKEINKMIAGYADGKKVLFLDFGDKFLQPDGTLSAEIMPDFLHPNGTGYRIWADAIQPTIDQFFPPSK